MGKRILSGLYLLAVTVVAVVACVGLMQVAQPWRGMLVLVLCGAGVVGAIVFLALRQHYAFQVLRTQQGGRSQTSRKRKMYHETAHTGGLRVVNSHERSGAQRILR